LENLPPDQRRAVAIVYDFGIPYSGDPISRLEVEAVQTLSRLMPTRIRVPRSLFDPIRALQAAVIRELGGACASIQDIAKYVGCRKRFVWEILHPS
jgi:hypothetical protein